MFTDEINNHLENKKHVVAIFHDFKKAFETLETETLINAIEECGVGIPLNKWFKDYLSGRSFRVKVDGTFSERTEIHCGVPHAARLGMCACVLTSCTSTACVEYCVTAQRTCTRMICARCALGPTLLKLAVCFSRM